VRMACSESRAGLYPVQYLAWPNRTDSEPLLMHKEALNLVDVHPWDVTPREAIAIQNRLREAVIREDALPEPIRYVAGVDVGFEAGGTMTRAAIAVLDYPGLALVESRLARLPTRFPYVPGLLSFRELPALLKAWETLDTLPDLILADGQGIAHPRRLGIAAHLGVRGRVSPRSASARHGSSAGMERFPGGGGNGRP